MAFHSINEEQNLYVMSEGSGFSCLGFDYAYKRALAVAKYCGCLPPSKTNIGTPDGYRDYERVMGSGAEYAQRTRTRCDAELIPELIGLENKRVEVVTASGETTRFYVGKSTGWMPCHLEIKRRNSSGGAAVMGAPFQSVRVIGAR